MKDIFMDLVVSCCTLTEICSSAD